MIVVRGVHHGFISQFRIRSRQQANTLFDSNGRTLLTICAFNFHRQAHGMKFSRPRIRHHFVDVRSQKPQPVSSPHPDAPRTRLSISAIHPASNTISPRNSNSAPLPRDNSPSPSYGSESRPLRPCAPPLRICKSSARSRSAPVPLKNFTSSEGGSFTSMSRTLPFTSTPL